METLQAIPNSRDQYALISTAPSMSARADVGGNTIGQQISYRAYGFSAQNRPMIEGMNASDVTAGNIFMFQDYGSLEQASVTAVGNTAEQAMGGVVLQFIAKSGGNKFGGTYVFDHSPEKAQWHNIDAKQLHPTPTGPTAIPSVKFNRLTKYQNVNVDLGGPIVKDRLWFYVSGVYQQNESRQAPAGSILDGTVFISGLQNLTGKGTYTLGDGPERIPAPPAPPNPFPTCDEPGTNTSQTLLNNPADLAVDPNPVPMNPPDQMKAVLRVTDLAFSREPAQNFLYDVDLGSDRIWILNRMGVVLAGIGRPGHQAGELTFPHTVALDSRGNVYISETINGRCSQKFVKIAE